MINALTLKFGRAPRLQPETITTTPVTVFVGPNNTGKSRVLTEIFQYCVSGERNISNVILDHIKFEDLSPDSAEDHIRRVTLPPHPSDTLRPDYIIVGKHQHRLNVSQNELFHALLNVNQRADLFCSWFLSYNTLMLDGKNRINLINDQNAGDLQATPQTSFQVLFSDNEKRETVRRIVYDAFNQHLVIDPTNLGQLRLRLSKSSPNSETQERGIHQDSVEFHGAATLIHEASDGVKAFVGIITEIIAGDPCVLLIDEPEAFLHPNLSFNLGKEIALASSGSNKRLFVSTHSPNFVMGCIQSGAPINIVRLTYRYGVATARLLKSQDLLSLMRNPLLRSTRVLDGLFYEFVVITEADTDRAFYQEINERMLRYKPEWGIPNCLFINAQNKQTVKTIMKPLRSLGIPAACIVDIDVIKEGGIVWRAFLEGGFVPEIERKSLAISRKSVREKLESTGKDMKRDGGVNLLQGGDEESATNLLDRLQEYGLFVVRRGQLESWLPELEVSGHGPAWLINTFGKMGEDPAAADYLRPDGGDVWLFLWGLYTKVPKKSEFPSLSA